MSLHKYFSKGIRAVFAKGYLFKFFTPLPLVKRVRLASPSAKTISFEIKYNYNLAMVGV